jgi:ADP-ribose pyrophosphatase YjhB (NUDIX family)
MDKRIRIVAIIVKNHKLLLVKGSEKEYWTPGGKREEGESDLECLKRELSEELNVKIVSAKFFGEYVAPSPYTPSLISESHIYITEISGEIKTGNEIKEHIWMSKQEYKNNKYLLTATTRDKIIPDLIKAGYF